MTATTEVAALTDAQVAALTDAEIDALTDAQVMQRFGARLARHPTHPGADLAASLERKSLSVEEAAALIGVERAVLDEVLAERAPMTAELAVRMQAAGWARAGLWMRHQTDYDIIMARRRLVSSGAIAADAVHPDPLHEPEWDPESIPLLEEDGAGAEAPAVASEPEPAPAALAAAG